jgi:ribosome biogenesis protein BMS1
LKIPKAIQRDLPFGSKPKQMVKRASNKPLYEDRRAVVLEPEEKKIFTLIQQLNTLKHEKDRKRKVKVGEQRAKYLKKKEREESKVLAKRKETSKDHFRKIGKEEARKRQNELSSAAFGSKRQRTE